MSLSEKSDLPQPRRGTALSGSVINDGPAIFTRQFTGPLNQVRPDKITSARPEAPTLTMVRLIVSQPTTAAIYLVAKLGIADRLKQGPKTASELAAEAEADSDALDQTLRALASLGIFIEDKMGRFGLTPLAELLISDNPDSLHSLALTMGRD